jgi:hypothetical protein
MRTFHETGSNQIINLIGSINVIKFFVREPIEAERNRKIQYDMTRKQMATRKTGFLLDSIKSLLE